MEELVLPAFSGLDLPSPLMVPPEPHCLAFVNFAHWHVWAGVSAAMGKSWKNRRHASTGYPYSHMRLAHVHIVRPKVRSEESNSLFLGEFPLGPTPEPLLFVYLSMQGSAPALFVPLASEK